MKEYRNFILINNDNFIVQATFANCSSDITYKCHKKQFPSKKPLTNNTDELRILNKHLAQILQWKESEIALSIYYVLIPPRLCKIIKEKIYKQWLEKGTYDSGVKLKPEELTQWKVFDMLYKKTFADIAFKPNNIYNSKIVNKNYKHIVFTKNAIDKMYVYIDKLEDSIKLKTIDDLLK